MAGTAEETDSLADRTDSPAAGMLEGADGTLGEGSDTLADGTVVEGMDTRAAGSKVKWH